MIDLLIFYFHFFVAVYAFTKSWQDGTIKEGFLAVGLIALIFSIGWALTGSLAYAIWAKAWDTVYFTHDTLSLILLTIPESVFFYHFFFKEKQKISQENLS